MHWLGWALPQPPVPAMQRKLAVPSVLAIGSAVLWGLVEFMALCRSRWATRLKLSRD